MKRHSIQKNKTKNNNPGSNKSQDIRNLRIQWKPTQGIPGYNKSGDTNDPGIQRIPGYNESQDTTNPGKERIPGYNKPQDTRSPRIQRIQDTQKNHSIKEYQGVSLISLDNGDGLPWRCGGCGGWKMDIKRSWQRVKTKNDNIRILADPGQK